MLGNSSEGGETETNNNDKFASAVFLTAVFIVVISICFEQGRHYVEHHASKVMQPMIQTLFAELTLLGFVGMLFFFAQRGKFLSILSADIFGEEEQGLLSEIFETVTMCCSLSWSCSWRKHWHWWPMVDGQKNIGGFVKPGSISMQMKMRL